MAIEVTDLLALDPDLVTQNREEAASRLQAANPTLYLKRGVLHDIAVHYAGGVLGTQNQTNIDRWRQSSSLAQIEVDPTLADDGIVDNLLSNFLITRQSATVAHGEVTIVVSGDTTVTVAKGAVFLAGDQQYLSDDTFVAKSELELVVADTDRLLVQQSDGSFAFNITVTAATAGKDGLLARNTLLEPELPPLDFISAFASSDFTGGVDEQTNADLINRLREGIAAKTLGASRINMTAWVRDPASGQEFNNILRMSIIGHGQPEQLRYHSLFPVAFGGRLDWYVRTSEQVIRTTLTKTASLVSKYSDNTGLWQFSLDRDDAAGFYDVVRVYSTLNADDAGSLPLVQETRGYDLSGDVIAPDITSAFEAAYSRFQTSVVQFHDTLTDASALSIGATADYQVEVRQLPLIDQVQDRIADPDHRPRVCDIVVRAAVPCFVELSFKVNRHADEDAPDTAGIASALAATVNQIGFTGRLPASLLYDVIHQQLAGGVSVGPMDMVGTLRRPDNSLLRLRSRDLLLVPEEPLHMVTARTVQFFLDPEDVAIEVDVIGPADL